VTTRCAVLGSPIGHSLSPTLHRAAYAALGLDWTYDRFEVTVDQLAGFVAGLDSHWRGLSVTMPLKVAVLDLGLVDEMARLAGAGNTLIFDGDVRRVHNTDVGGLVSAVRRISAAPARRITILGTGATARSALLSAAQLGAEEVTVIGRTPARAAPLQGLGARLELGVRVQDWTSPLPGADLVISTAVAGAVDAIAPAVAASAPLIFDAIYDPWPTELAAVAGRAGCTVINGLDLLIGQALLQIELMTGRAVPAATLYAALPAHLTEAQSV
jgi:shikimate dehydrogenase